MVRSDIGYSEKGTDRLTSKNSSIRANDAPRTRIREGQLWQTGHRKRFPLFNFCCLVIVIALFVGAIVVLIISNNKDVDTWCTGYIRYRGGYHRVQITVSVWISLICFLSGQALAVVFSQGLTISWWVGAMKGRTLNQLHHDWDAGQSLLSAVSKPKLISWVCIATIANAVFSAMGTVLQKASTTTTVSSEIPSTMTTTLAGAIPAGYSGIIASSGDGAFDIGYLNPRFIQVIQNFSSKAILSVEVDGCPGASNVSCATVLTGIGFQYSCEAGRQNISQAVSTVSPTHVVFQTAYDWNYTTPWQIAMSALWQDKTESEGSIIATRSCTLVPAIVEYPVHISSGVITLQPPSSNVQWTTAPTSSQEETLAVDEVVKTLPRPNLDSNMIEYYQLNPGQNSTLGGFAFAFNSLFASAIKTTYDGSNDGGNLEVDGAFAASFAVFPRGIANDELIKTAYASPMNQLLAHVREIMFRSSIAVVQHNITDLAVKPGQPAGSFTVQIETDYVPSLTSSRAGIYITSHAIYQTSLIPLLISVALVVIVICCMLPLYNSYWKLGREVSLSPLEVAKALHQPANIEINGRKELISILDVNMNTPGGERIEGSNYTGDDLVNMLGDVRVRYGEVEPHVMGMGPAKNTRVLHGGLKYR